MLRGYYTAASGIVSQEKRLNAIANNISNSAKAGYKKDDLVFSTFGEHIAVRMNTYNQSPLHRIGSGAWMQTVDEKYTSYEQGGFDMTGRSLDIAIQGEGFFLINTPDGERLTRDGQFALDAEGYLVLPGYGRVQGVDGELQIGQSEFYVAQNGAIYLPPEEEGDEMTELGRLAIAIPEDYAALEKEASGLFVSDGFGLLEAEGDRRGILLQQTVERSNVNMSEEMARMISTQRSLQSASQLVKMYDEMSSEANSRLSSVR